MTSASNHADTVRYFEANERFGLAEKNVTFFQQGTLPAFTEEGKLILATPSCVAEAPDGNGGVYRALESSGALAAMEERGVEGVHVFSVDNALCKVADPVFVGYCATKDADVGNKCVWKSSPDEKVGVVCKKNGAPAVVEYTEMPAALNGEVDEAGKLVYGAGNVCNHLYKTSFLHAACHALPGMLAHHVARKVVACATGESGMVVRPEAPNAVKLESFIFDAFVLAHSQCVLQVAREAEFSPVKNPPGSSASCAETAKADLRTRDLAWIAAAGGDAQNTTVLEISPLVSYDGEGLETQVGERTFNGELRLGGPFSY